MKRKKASGDIIEPGHGNKTSAIIKDKGINDTITIRDKTHESVSTPPPSIANKKRNDTTMKNDLLLVAVPVIQSPNPVPPPNESLPKE